MVGRVVDCVDTDGVDSQLLELLDVALAAVGVRDGVLSLRGTAGLVVNTADVEALVTGVEGCEMKSVCDLDSGNEVAHTIALDGDSGNAARAGARGAGLKLGRGGGGAGERGGGRGDSDGALHFA